MHRCPQQPGTPLFMNTLHTQLSLLLLLVLYEPCPAHEYTPLPLLMGKHLLLIIYFYWQVSEM